MELTTKETLQNAIADLQRAYERLKELGDFSEDTITEDEVLLNDIALSIERLSDVELNY